MEKIKLTDIKVNPKNPRIIKDARFEKLCDNIKRYPKFLELRPIVVESRKNPVILGGNMRYTALQHLGYKEIPKSWIRYADELTAEEQQAFIIIDNVPFGEWDMDALESEWSVDQLNDWGIELPDIQFSEPKKIKEEDIRPFIKTHVLISFSPEQLTEIEPYLEKIKKIPLVEYEQSSN